MDWFLYDNGLRHERVKISSNQDARNADFTWFIKLSEENGSKYVRMDYVKFVEDSFEIIWCA